MEKNDEPSTLYQTIKAGAEGAVSPSPGAKIVGGILAPPGAKEAAAQGLQIGANAALFFSKGFMEGVVRQHGKSPSAELNNMKIHQAISSHGQSNKGIEAFRQKESAKQTAPNTGESTNKGIKSYQSKAGGQSTDSSKGGASSTTKGSSENSGKSSGGQGR